MRLNCLSLLRRTFFVLGFFVPYLLNAQPLYDITRFGAVGDGTTDNTAAIQRAIDSSAKTGGKVFFPTGTFLSATLYLKSNATLHLSAGAILLGQADASKYPYQDPGIPFYGDQWAKQALIFCKGQENVTIEGKGTIDGQGARFVVNTIKKPDRYKNRPYLLWFAGSRNITVRDVSLRNSAFWMQHYLGCEFVLIDGIHIWNHSNKNNDMIDIDGSRNVTITNITGDSDDDGITIKSTSPRISENITITNCIVSSHCNGIKFGTESTGGFRNVTVSNCVIRPSAQRQTIYGKPDGISGLALEVVDGGIMENITISNIIIEGPQVPIFIRLGNRARKFSDTAAAPSIGRIRHIRISDIIARGADTVGCSITGLEKVPVEDITLSNITIETSGSDIAGKPFATVVPEKEEEYPEGTMFGKLPAYGMYVRYAKDIQLHNIVLRHKGTEQRPGIMLDRVQRFQLTGLDIQNSSTAPAAVAIARSAEGTINNANRIEGLTNRLRAVRFVVRDNNTTNVWVDNKRL